MNERIRELLAEARLFCYDDGTVSLLGETHVGQAEIEKFAELIVRECLFIIDDERKPDMVNRTELWHQIVEHFGVK